MALTACPECDAQISNKASKCPKCGFELKKTKKKSGFFSKFLIVLVLAAVGIGIAVNRDKLPKASGTSSGQRSSGDAAQPNHTPELTVNADKIISDYKANEVSADATYKGKHCAITGYVDGVKKGAFSGVYITMRGNEKMELASVTCDLVDEAQVAKASQLKPGDKITVIGKVNGFSFMKVKVSNCRIADGNQTVTSTTNKPQEVVNNTPKDPIEVAREKGRDIGSRMLAIKKESMTIMNEVVVAAQNNDTFKAQELQTRLNALKSEQSKVDREGTQFAESISQKERDAFIEGYKEAQKAK